MCAKMFHEVAQQTDENKSRKYAKVTTLQIIESYGNVNEAEIHGTIDKACDSSTTNVNTEVESLRGQGKEDNHCQTDRQMDKEENFDGEMKEDVVNVLIEVENTGPIDQQNILLKEKDCQNIPQQAKFPKIDRGMVENQDEAAQINYKDELLKVGNIVAVRPYIQEIINPVDHGLLHSKRNRSEEMSGCMVKWNIRHKVD
ncbi:unnamed protein product [Mytilus coruscus]|uniref:Uncharacterized protein n=1 Tax=Mytilus coruscus TaxID=42192 RepID=A0A6J8CQC7_MYTCO|nr:unnamed protein product [Mytilus coruscus]